MMISRTARGEGGSLPLALLAAIIVAGLAVVLVARIVATQNQVRFDEGFHASLPVADAGTNLGKFWLNNDNLLQATGDAPECDDGFYLPSDFPIGCTTPPETRVIDGNEYTFTLTRISSRDWEITSTGTDARSGESRRAVATIRERPLVDVALFAETFISFGGNNAADSYTSDQNVPQEDSWCTGRGYIATNGTLDFSGTSGSACSSHNRTIDRAMLHKWDENPATSGVTDEYPGGNRCVHSGGGGGANCRTVSEENPEYLEPEIFDDELELATDAKVAFIEHALTACDGDTENNATIIEGEYRTSDGIPGHMDPGVLRPGAFDPDKASLPQPFEFPGDVDGPYMCVDQLYLDVNTKIDTDGDNPVIIVVRDRVTIKGQAGPGGPANVGCEDTGGNVVECVAGDPSGVGASRPDARRLWIFTDGDIAIGNHSAFSGVIWAPRGDCDGDAQADIFGSLICGTLPQNLGGWKFHYDEALAEISSGEFYTSSWREEFITD